MFDFGGIITGAVPRSFGNLRHRSSSRHVLLFELLVPALRSLPRGGQDILGGLCDYSVLFTQLISNVITTLHNQISLHRLLFYVYALRPLLECRASVVRLWPLLICWSSLLAVFGLQIIFLLAHYLLQINPLLLVALVSIRHLVFDFAPLEILDHLLYIGVDYDILLQHGAGTAVPGILLILVFVRVQDGVGHFVDLWFCLVAGCAISILALDHWLLVVKVLTLDFLRQKLHEIVDLTLLRLRQ